MEIIHNTPRGGMSVCVPVLECVYSSSAKTPVEPDVTWMWWPSHLSFEPAVGNVIQSTDPSHTLAEITRIDHLQWGNRFGVRLHVKRLTPQNKALNRGCLNLGLPDRSMADKMELWLKEHDEEITEAVRRGRW